MDYYLINYNYNLKLVVLFKVIKFYLKLFKNLITTFKYHFINFL